jgi:tRNA threonylcarbamoyladenosine biosynthesis protein TsaB
MWLGIDTSGAVSVAVGTGPDDAGTAGQLEVLAVRQDLRARHHDEVLLGLVDGVLADAGAARSDLTAVVAGRGPGPFTGLRVGLVVARTLAAVLDLPLYGMCSLDALAHQAATGGQDPRQETLDPRQPTQAAEQETQAAEGTSVFVALDARRHQVYWARYRVDARGLPVLQAGPDVALPADVAPSAADADLVVGSGAHLYADQLHPTAEVSHVDAGHLLRLAAARVAAAEDLTDTDPLYLREPDAKRPSAHKSALGR